MDSSQTRRTSSALHFLRRGPETATYAYSVVLDGRLAGERKSNRIYTHAVVVTGAAIDLVEFQRVEHYCGSHELACKAAARITGYPTYFGKPIEELRVVIVPLRQEAA